MTCGIYKIENQITKERYIGCSVNIEQRFETHKYHYNNENLKDYSLRLYEAMRTYGIDSFVFSILEICKEEELPITQYRLHLR